MARKRGIGNIITDLERQINDDYNALISLTVEGLSTEQNSPVDTGFFASSWSKYPANSSAGQTRRLCPVVQHQAEVRAKPDKTALPGAAVQLQKTTDGLHRQRNGVRRLRLGISQSRQLHPRRNEIPGTRNVPRKTCGSYFLPLRGGQIPSRAWLLPWKN